MAPGSSGSRSSRIRSSQTCPTCGGQLRKLISSPAFQFKGSGFYITDYARKSGTTASRRRSEGREGHEGREGREGRQGSRPGRRVGDKDASKSRRKSRRDESSKTDKPGSTERQLARRSHLAERRGPSSVRRQPRRRHDVSWRGDLTSPWLQRCVAASNAFQILPERPGQIRPPQREIHDGLQEAELVAGVVADAGHLAGVERPLREQPLQPVGELNLADAVASRSPRASRRCRASGCSGR